MELTLGSLFDGSGGFPLAGAINGIKPIWASEIEPYPLRVTETRLPSMKQLGSVTDIDGAAIAPVDIITFGSPCQDLSIAGAQKGLHKGERSSLFFEAIRIIKEMRARDRENAGTVDHIRPRFAVWENVPGAFSSNKGQDFRAVLQAFCEVCDINAHVPEPEKGRWGQSGCIVGDGYSIAWRVYDAQYWGVPQRRKRIYLIADFASERAGEILFERESLRWHPAKSGEPEEGVAKCTASGIGRSGEAVYCLQGNGIDRALTAGCNGKGWRQNECYTLNTIDRPAVVFGKELCNSGVGCTGGHYVSENEPASTLRTNAPPGVAYPHVTGTLCANSHPGSYTGQDAYNDMLPVVPMDEQCREYIVRRLTPLECCRLQGFPDWWEHGVEGSDSARYKMWGNGIALPCAVDVLQRISKEMVNPE